LRQTAVSGWSYELALQDSNYAVIVLLLAVTSIHAAVAFAAMQRTHGIGARMSLVSGNAGVLTRRSTSVDPLIAQHVE